jgi:two-component system sensor histidine kinase KdpD
MKEDGMSKRALRCIKNLAMAFLIIAAAFGISILLQDVLDISEHITTLFAFAVFIISLVTDGYWYGIGAAAVSVIAINYAFTYPYFNMDFTPPETIFSAIVMFVISFLTGMLTTNLKKWQKLKAEGEMERMRANLLRAVSHDLRTPLTTIYGASSSIIENNDKLSEAQKLQMTVSIKEDSEWLIRMVENLLSVTRIDSGMVKLLKTPTVLEELIDSVILKFKKRYPSQTVELDLPEEIVLIPMDAILIEQVIVNILENAVCHAEGLTKINLRVSVNCDTAFFEISDDGCGIDKDKLDGIFLGYREKLRDASDTNKRGFGIGLSVCATIIKAHGGSISAENSDVGGAVFSFSLPIDEEISNEQ